MNYQFRTILEEKQQPSYGTGVFDDVVALWASFRGLTLQGLKLVCHDTWVVEKIPTEMNIWIHLILSRRRTNLGSNKGGRGTSTTASRCLAWHSACPREESVSM
jgi:hypothetical protein